MDITLFLKFLIWLITIISPLSTIPILISLTWNYSKKELKQTVLKAVIILFIASTLILLFWDFVLWFFGINVASIKVIWWIILLLLSIQMINSKWTLRTNKSKEVEKEIQKEIESKQDISIVPLAMPLLFWPWIISTLIIYKNTTKSIEENILLFLSLITACFIIYLILSNAFYIKKIIWYTWLQIVEKISGLILWWIASQFIISWVKALWLIL